MQNSRLLCAVLGKRGVGKSALIENISHSNKRLERETRRVPTLGMTVLSHQEQPALLLELKDFEPREEATITRAPVPARFTHAVVLGNAAIGNIWDEWTDMEATARRLKEENHELVVTTLFTKNDLLSYNKRNTLLLESLFFYLEGSECPHIPHIVGFDCDGYGGTYGYSEEDRTFILEHIFSGEL